MEESTQSLHTKGEEEHENDFYEKIEAPKFVDLTAPDRFQPGEDRFWFCSRVGCDQKHEEELDPEAIYKSFVLRVMAARSPNIRLRKALYRKDPSAEKKCPRTLPPKPSKPRISRLALISSMSKRVVDPKLKLKAPSKQKATPAVKAKPSSVGGVKALTTPRDQKRVANVDAFQSVGNQKATAVAVPQNRVVAKALFLSPKKSAREKTSSELNTPVKTLCAETKKLEISDGRKPALGCNRRLPSDASRKQPRAREVKSRVYDRLLPPDGKGQNARSDKDMKKKKNKDKDTQNNSEPVPPEEVRNDARGMGIEENSSKDSRTSTCDERNVHEGLHISNVKLGESVVETSPNRCRSDLHSQERNPAGSDHAKSSQTASRDSDENNQKREEDEIKSSSEEVTMESSDNRHNVTSNDKENDSGVMESDDKENASASDDNRKLNLDTDHPQRDILGKHIPPKSTGKMARALDKPSRDGCTSGTHGLKHAKSKATNPKPFRLRTDERRILKEANMEKKLQLPPLKEITSDPGLPRESLRKRHQVISRRKEKFEQTKYEGKEKGINRMKRERPPIDSSTLKIAKERAGRRFPTIPQRHTVSSQQKLVTPRQENNLDNGPKRFLKRTKSPHLRQLSRQQEAASITTDTISVVIPGQLSVIKESPPAISRPKEPAKTSEVEAVPQ